MTAAAVALDPGRKSGRAIGLTIARRWREAERVREKCATWSDMLRCQPAPEPDLPTMYACIGRRLTPSERDVYALIRGAVRKGFVGCCLTVDEIRQRLGGHDFAWCRRTVFRALKGLAELDLIRVVRRNEPAAWQEIKWGGDRPRPGRCWRSRQHASVYMLGPAALRPGKGYRPRPAARNGNTPVRRFRSREQIVTPPEHPPIPYGDRGAENVKPKLVVDNSQPERPEECVGKPTDFSPAAGPPRGAQAIPLAGKREEPPPRAATGRNRLTRRTSETSKIWRPLPAGLDGSFGEVIRAAVSALERKLEREGPGEKPPGGDR